MKAKRYCNCNLRNDRWHRETNPFCWSSVNSSVSGVGVSHSEETMTAATAQTLARITSRPAAWRAYGFSGATVREATWYHGTHLTRMRRNDGS
jgi:hypothetical protein